MGSCEFNLSQALQGVGMNVIKMGLSCQVIPNMQNEAELKGSMDRVIMPVDLKFNLHTEFSQFIEFPRGQVKMVIAESSMIKIPTLDGEYFDNPSLMVKYNSNYGFDK